MSMYDDEPEVVAPMTDDMWQLAGLCWDWYQLEGNEVGGVLHIVLDDGNVETDHIKWCITQAATKADYYGVTGEHAALMGLIVTGLLQLDFEQRRAVYHFFNPYSNDRPAPITAVSLNEEWARAVFAYRQGSSELVQAKLVVPDWALERLLAASVVDQAMIGRGVIGIALQSGLGVPVLVYVAGREEPAARINDDFTIDSLDAGDILDPPPEHEAAPSSPVPGKWVQLDPGGTIDAMIVRDGEVAEYHGTPEGLPPLDDINAPGWSHQAVAARYPSGTDPLAAIRESMSVFMERTDGSNAMPWWTQLRWWHGGPYGLKKGESILPPSVTGVVPGMDMTDKSMVYITSERDHALLFAARHDRPTLYEVVLDGEPIPDDLVPNERTSGRRPLARIHRVEVPSKFELRRTMYELSATADDATPPDVVDR